MSDEVLLEFIKIQAKLVDSLIESSKHQSLVIDAIYSKSPEKFEELRVPRPIVQAQQAPAQDLVPVSDLTDEEFDDHIKKQVE